MLCHRNFHIFHLCLDSQYPSWWRPQRNERTKNKNCGSQLRECGLQKNKKKKIVDKEAKQFEHVIIDVSRLTATNGLASHQCLATNRRQKSTFVQKKNKSRCFVRNHNEICYNLCTNFFFFSFFLNNNTPINEILMTT